jgi:hypothetical protein
MRLASSDRGPLRPHALTDQLRNFFPRTKLSRAVWEDTPMRLNLVCPDTSEPVSFEVEDDAASVSRNWKTSLAVKCPHCGDTHAVAFKEAYVDGILTGFRDDFDRLLLGAH